MAWTTITVEGGLFPADLLDELAEGHGDGQREEDFGLASKERGRLSDDIQRAFSDARSYWDTYQRRLDRTAPEQRTRLSREAWTIPFFGLLGFREGDLVPPAEPPTIDDVAYRISHFAGAEKHAPPIHIVGAQYSLNRRPPNSRLSPHALVQQFLNRDDALWGIITNGRQLRLLRDSQRMTKPTYLEFDLEGMISGSQYAEFALLYRMLHRTRFPRGTDDAHTCLLERWFEQGIAQGGCVRDQLRDGVEQALERLGRGFLQHRDSTALRQQIAAGRLTAADYYRQLLRLIYRLLFLMVAEERRLLFPTQIDGQSDRQPIYDQYYSVSQLRERAALPDAARRESTRHTDLWQGLLTTCRIFRKDALADQLGLHVLNGELFGEPACRQLEAARLSNADLLWAIDRLGRFDADGTIRRVNYAGLDVEELGSVYESLLEFEPRLTVADSAAPALWDFQLGAGGGRKSTGSYYTPRELVSELIDSALVPVIEQRLRDAGPDSAAWEAALLSLTVIDPAAGSGHFLLAAARRIARELARLRTGEGEPAPLTIRQALREVVPQCIYGVDKNHMAVDLCKVALWIEGHAPGQPLSFLDHHIKHGDSLIGVYDLDVLEQGVPDGAYKALTGDDKKLAQSVKAVNKRHRQGLEYTLFEGGPTERSAQASAHAQLRNMPDNTPAAVAAKADAYARLRRDGLWERTACDLWTYAFFAPLTAADEPLTPTSDDVRRQHRAQVNAQAIAAARAHPYFHWPLEFPDIFAQGGFDVVLGNPPWDRYRLAEREFFADREPTIAAASKGSERKKMIAALQVERPALYDEYSAALRLAEGQPKYARESKRFPRGAVGQINLYQLFAELAPTLLNPAGRAGMIAPTGLATDNNTRKLFGQLVSLFDFENRQRVFPGIDSRIKFCLLTLSGESAAPAEFAFFLHHATDLADAERRFTLAADDFALLNRNTGNCPIFRTRRDADLTRAIYRQVPILLDGSGRIWTNLDESGHIRPKPSPIQANSARI